MYVYAVNIKRKVPLHTFPSHPPPKKNFEYFSTKTLTNDIGRRTFFSQVVQLFVVNNFLWFTISTP